MLQSISTQKPTFAGVIIRTQPMKRHDDEPGLGSALNLQIAVVPNTFVQGIRYKDDTVPSRLADEVTRNRRSLDVMAMGVIDPPAQARLFTDLIRESPMPWDDKPTAFALIRRALAVEHPFRVSRFKSTDGFLPTDMRETWAFDRYANQLRLCPTGARRWASQLKQRLKALRKASFKTLCFSLCELHLPNNTGPSSGWSNEAGLD